MQDSTVSGEADVHVTVSQTMRRQLSAAGKRLRKEFYATTQDPTEDEKEQLRQRIGRLPGCEWYLQSSRPDINYQSSVRRKKAKKLGAIIQEIYNEKITFMSRCLDTCPNPDLKTIMIWAECCQADPSWVFEQAVAHYLYRTGRTQQHG